MTEGAVFRAVVSDVGDFKRRFARSQLKLARAWSAEAGMDFDFKLSLDEVRLTVWLKETANILRGHVLEAHLEHGEIIEVSLAGLTRALLSPTHLSRQRGRGEKPRFFQAWRTAGRLLIGVHRRSSAAITICETKSFHPKSRKCPKRLTTIMRSN